MYRMSETSNAVISSKKVSACVAGYIWDSPCLKPLMFNPFLVAALILLVIWAMDLFYGKTFTHGSVSTLIQHMATTYVIVAAGVALNNMLIKHHYRLDKHAKKVDDVTIQGAGMKDHELSSSYISEY